MLSLLPLSYGYMQYSLQYAAEQYTKLLEFHYTSVLLLEEGNLRMDGLSVVLDYDNDDVLGNCNPNAKYHYNLFQWGSI